MVTLPPQHPHDRGFSSASEARAAIRRAIDGRILASPNGDINAPLIKDMLSDGSISMERVSGALRRLEATGMLFIDRREKVIGKEAAKDRKVIQYKATDVYKRKLGLGGPASTVTTVATMLHGVQAYAARRGFIASVEDLANFFLCLQAKPLVLLSGISGTGKTRLPRLFAEATDSAHQLIPVKPNWADNSDLMGYYSATIDRFVPGQLLEAIRAALDDPTRPHFVVLDEMNLAHVEHYLSDLLSVMETRRRDDYGDVVTDVLPIDLPALIVQGPNVQGTAVESGEDEGAAQLHLNELSAESRAELLDSLRDVTLPWNLFLVGTVNVDETTHPFSRKVLDRAFVIEFGDVDLAAFGSSSSRGENISGAHPLVLDRPLAVHEIVEIDRPFFEEIAQELVMVNHELRPAGLHFAYRVRDEIALYLWAWRRHKLDSLLSRDDAFDFCLLQKVLPRCQGSSDTARRALEGVFRHATAITSATAEKVPAEVAAQWEVRIAPGGQVEPDAVTEPPQGYRWRYPRTARKALDMLRRYIDTGYFAFWS